jgi:hypothetical protein
VRGRRGRKDEEIVNVSSQWETSADQTRKRSDQEYAEESVKILGCESIRRRTTDMHHPKGLRSIEITLERKVNSREELLLVWMRLGHRDLRSLHANFIAMTNGRPRSLITHESEIDLLCLIRRKTEYRKRLTKTPWKDQVYLEINRKEDFQIS